MKNQAKKKLQQNLLEQQNGTSSYNTEHLSFYILSALCVWSAIVFYILSAIVL